METDGQAQPQPVPAQLARTLLNLAPTPQVRISTGYPDVDKALGGGFDCGRITAVSGASDTGKSLVTFQAITTYLIAQPFSQVAVLDTTGQFSPRWLFEIVSQRLRGQVPPLSDKEIENAALSALDRVKVMRVFDLIGVVDAVNEVRESCEPRIQSSSGDDGEQEGRPVARHSGLAAEQTARDQEGPEQDDQEIPDSEDECQASQESQFLVDPGSRMDIETNVKEMSREVSNQVGVFVVDTVTAVVNDATRISTVEGNSLLMAFLRSLSQLASHHSICVLLLNNAVGLRPRRSEETIQSESTAQRREQGPQTSQAPSIPQKPSTQFPRDGDDVSIFGSVPGKPALGRTFKHCVDIHVWLSKVPWRINDSELIARGRERRAKEVRVLEVLSDRIDARTNRWGGFGEGEVVANDS